jgi:hypothetical protein
VISASQLRRRRDELGLWVYCITFCALVWVAQARADKGKRGYIERFFALLKHYLRLNDLHTQGLRLAIAIPLKWPSRSCWSLG